MSAASDSDHPTEVSAVPVEPSERFKFDVFISHSSSDKTLADAVCHTLEANGLRCWIAPRDIVPGSEWSEGIFQGIDSSRTFVLVFTNHANESKHVLREVGRAFSKNNVVIPFRVDDSQPSGGLEFWISQSHWLDAMTPPLQEHLDRLVQVVRKNLDLLPTPPSPPQPPRRSMVNPSQPGLDGSAAGKKSATSPAPGAVSSQDSLAPQSVINTQVTGNPNVGTRPQSKPGSLPQFKTLGRYTVIGELGRGGMGAVYLAEDTVLKRKVALKIPQFDIRKEEQMRARFIQEVQHAARLTHPNICQTYDVDEIDGQLVMVMEYIEGRNLSALTKPDKLMSERDAAGLVRKIAMAIEVAHRQGLVHRDLKPSNIMLIHPDKSKKMIEPKVMDFGLAKSLESTDQKLTQSGMIVGTPCYMSKEQWSGKDGSLSPASDIYSLGVMLYELLTGYLPYDSDEGEPATAWFVKLVTRPQILPTERKPGINAGLEAIVMRSIARDVENRYATMAEFAMALDEWINGKPTEVWPVGQSLIELPSDYSEIGVLVSEPPVTDNLPRKPLGSIPNWMVWAGGGVVALLLGIVLAFREAPYYSSSPARVSLEDENGKEFYPNFQDANVATSLEVGTYDKKASKTSTFSIEFKDGYWRIPSHNNYPAASKDRLKQTASSFIGIKRGTLAGKNIEAHNEYNLLDPLDQSINETEGRGDRIILKAEGKVLVDYIVGKKKEGPGNTYYIRRADEGRFFLSEVKIELSTKFKDWIDPDLLDLKQDDIQTVLIDRYSVNEAEGKINQGEQSILRRENSTAEWKIEGIDAATQKPKNSVISLMLRSLENLKITGVRRKPEGLSASLQVDDAIKLTQSTRLDLQNHGYFYIPEKGIVSDEGDMLVSTYDGVSYVLRFGEVFDGSDVEFEVGSPNATANEPAIAEGEKKEGDKPDNETKRDDAATSGADNASKKNRFVFIMAQHDPRLLGEPPVEPVKPEPPMDEVAPADAKSDAATAEGEKKDGNAATPPTADPKTTAKETYDEAMKKYQSDSDAYRFRKKEHDDKLAAGEKRAKELNGRFADWYYVIPEDLFDELRVKSEDLVEAVPPPEKLSDTPPLPSPP